MINFFELKSGLKVFNYKKEISKKKKKKSWNTNSCRAEVDIFSTYSIGSQVMYVSYHKCKWFPKFSLGSLLKT